MGKSNLKVKIKLIESVCLALTLCLLSCVEKQSAIQNKGELISVRMNDSTINIFDSPNNTLHYTVQVCGKYRSFDSASFRGLVAYVDNRVVSYFDAEVIPDERYSTSDSTVFFVKCKLPWAAEIRKKININPKLASNCNMLIWVINRDCKEDIPIKITISPKVIVEVQVAPDNWKFLR